MTRYFSATESEARRRRSIRRNDTIVWFGKIFIIVLASPFVLMVWLVHRIFFKRKAS